MNKINQSAKLILIIFIMSVSYSCSDDEVEHTGILENRPVGQVGVWVIDGQPYAVSKKAELDEEHGPLGIGACVEANYGGFKKGKIIQHWDDGNAYRIKLDEDGREIYAPMDIDVYVRAVQSAE